MAVTMTRDIGVAVAVAGPVAVDRSVPVAMSRSVPVTMGRSVPVDGRMDMGRIGHDDRPVPVGMHRPGRHHGDHHDQRPRGGDHDGPAPQCTLRPTRTDEGDSAVVVSRVSWACAAGAPMMATPIGIRAVRQRVIMMRLRDNRGAAMAATTLVPQRPPTGFDDRLATALQTVTGARPGLRAAPTRSRDEPALSDSAASGSAAPDPAAPDRAAPLAHRRPGALAVAAILLAGVCAATSIGKLPPSLPVLREAFGLSLVQASWLVSVFQVAGLALGLFGGLLADRFGPRRTMGAGLTLLAFSSAAGAASDSAAGLLLLRALESAGFLLTVLPGPSLLRRIVSPARLSAVLGGWSCYMPTGMSAMMIATPVLLAVGGWRLAWLAAAGLAIMAALAVAMLVPPDEPRPAGAHGAAALARATLATPGAWLLALCFGLYAGQFITVFSFLPTIYQSAGLGAAVAGLLSAIGVAFNVVGNLVAGTLLGRGARREQLIMAASVVMAVCALAAFSPALPFGWRYAAAVLLSATGGMIPGTLFATAPRVAPHPGAVATTTGLMQQGSALGQFVLPPVAAAVASGAGGWPAAAGVLAACAIANLFVAGWVGRAAAAAR